MTDGEGIADIVMTAIPLSVSYGSFIDKCVLYLCCADVLPFNVGLSTASRILVYGLLTDLSRISRLERLQALEALEVVQN
jgi:hypothetical protein